MHKKLHKKIFITATGTEIGKTFITCLLNKYLQAKGLKPFCAKPLITGFSYGDLVSDSALILDSLGLEYNEENLDKISPWRFKLPLAPNMASAKENITINFEQIVNFINLERTEYDVCLFEGAGGLMSPITDHKHNLDLIKASNNIEVILVSGSYLGAISHLLTCVKVLEQANIKIKSVIINESIDSQVKLEDTYRSVVNFIDYKINKLPRIKGADEHISVEYFDIFNNII